MKQKSYTSAILKLATLTTIVLSSSWYGYDYYSRYEAAYENQTVAEATLSEEQASLDKLRKVLTPEKAIPKAADKLDTFMEKAWNSAGSRELQVKLVLMNPSVKAVQGSSGMASFLDTLPKTRLKSGQVEITGKYESYSDFKAFMEDMSNAGGFLSQINVRGTAFKLVYRVYGN